MKHLKTFQLFEKTKEENETIIGDRLAEIEDKKTAQKDAKDKRKTELEKIIKTRANEITVKNRIAQIDKKKKEAVEESKKDVEKDVAFFYDCVEEKDEDYSENYVTTDATDIYDELVEEHGEEYSDVIRQAVERFYEIDLDNY